MVPRNERTLDILPFLRGSHAQRTPSSTVQTRQASDRLPSWTESICRPSLAVGWDWDGIFADACE